METFYFTEVDDFHSIRSGGLKKIESFDLKSAKIKVARLQCQFKTVLKIYNIKKILICSKDGKSRWVNH